MDEFAAENIRLAMENGRLNRERLAIKEVLVNAGLSGLHDDTIPVRLRAFVAPRPDVATGRTTHLGRPAAMASKFAFRMLIR